MEATNISQLFFYNLFQITSALSPLYAYLIYKLNGLNRSPRFFRVFQLSVLGLCGVIFFWYPTGYERTPRVTLTYYPLFILLASILFSVKFPRDYTRITSLSILVGFLQTELHEIPAFLQEYVDIGVTSFWVNQWHPLTHLYTGVVFLLGAQIARVKLTRWHLLYFVLAVLATYGCYLMQPNLDLIPHSALNFLKRWIWFYVTMLLYLIGGSP